jgi:hypothetical protein
MHHKQQQAGGPPAKLSAATEVMSWYSRSLRLARRKGISRLMSNCSNSAESGGKGRKCRCRKPEQTWRVLTREQGAAGLKACRNN